MTSGICRKCGWPGEHDAQTCRYRQLEAGLKEALVTLTRIGADKPGRTVRRCQEIARTGVDEAMAVLISVGVDNV